MRSSRPLVMGGLLLLLLSPAGARADELALSVALEGAAAWTESTSTYELFEDEDDLVDASDRVSLWGPSTALTVELRGNLGGIVWLGGLVRAGVAGAPPSAHTEELDVQVSFATGASLRLESDDPAQGAYGGIWFGLSGVLPRWIGWASGVDAGYRWRVGDGWSFALGASFTMQWSYDAEDGDHGAYEYEQLSLLPALHVRMSYALR